VAHELAGVLGERALKRAIARVGLVGAARPFPRVAVELRDFAGGWRGGERPRVHCAGLEEIAGDAARCRDVLPFVLERQARAGPARERLGLVEADVAHRLVRIDRALAGERRERPLGAATAPIQLRAPAVRAARVPTV